MADNQDSILLVRSDQEYSNYCNNDMKYFRVNYHFIQDDNGNLNMTETDDGGLGFTNLNGYEYAEEMIKEANRQHSLNQDHFLKDANHTYTPIPEIPIRYVLAGVYFHQSTAARNAHHYNWTYFDANCVNCDTEINIFDTNLGEADQIGGPSGIGNTIGGNIDLKVKVKSYIWYMSNNWLGWVLPNAAKNLNHEIGHTFNLWHEASNDYCNDTPTNSGCWNLNSPTNLSPCNDANPWCCDEQTELSNNLMGYNAFIPPALTNCQISRINEKMSRVENIDYIYACDVCPDIGSEEAPAYANFNMNKNLYWWYEAFNNIVLEGIASFNEDIFEIEICYLGNSSSNNQNCQSSPFSTGILNGSVGDIDLHNYYNFNPDSRYKITLKVDNTNCPLQHEASTIIKIRSKPFIPSCRVQKVVQRGQQAAAYFTLNESAEYNIYVARIVEPSTFIVITEGESFEEGEQIVNFSTEDLQTGIYKILIEPVILEQGGGIPCSSRFFVRNRN